MDKSVRIRLRRESAPGQLEIRIGELERIKRKSKLKLTGSILVPIASAGLLYFFHENEPGYMLPGLTTLVAANVVNLFYFADQCKNIIYTNSQLKGKRRMYYFYTRHPF